MVSAETWIASIVGAFVVCVLGAEFLPRRKDGPHTLRFRVIWLPVMASVAPIVGLAASLLIAGMWHAADTTGTHCRVYNFWPSISSAIGNNMPERFIWRLAVGLHNIICILDSFIMYHNLRKHGAGRFAARFCFLTKVFCCMSLYLLTYVSSGENFAVHKVGFVMWLVFGALFMISFALTFRSLAYEPRPWARTFMRTAYGCYFACFPVAIFFYWLHNYTCWPYIYSCFGITEFLLVIAYIFGAGFTHFIVFGMDQADLVLQDSGIKVE